LISRSDYTSTPLFGRIAEDQIREGDSSKGFKGCPPREREREKEKEEEEEKEKEREREREREKERER
jgi:hypothetical protein